MIYQERNQTCKSSTYLKDLCIDANLLYQECKYVYFFPCRTQECLLQITKKMVNDVVTSQGLCNKTNTIKHLGIEVRKDTITTLRKIINRSWSTATWCSKSLLHHTLVGAPLLSVWCKNPLDHHVAVVQEYIRIVGGNMGARGETLIFEIVWHNTFEDSLKRYSSRSIIRVPPSFIFQEFIFSYFH